MTDDTAKAVALVQARLSRFEHNSFWRAEQAEEALNFLLSQPDRTGPPPFLARNALSDAAKKLKRRTSITLKYAPTIAWMGEQTSDGFDDLVIETSNLIARRLDALDQKVLRLACDAGETDELSRALDIPPARARERLSRARARARAAREAA